MPVRSSKAVIRFRIEPTAIPPELGTPMPWTARVP
ncbi:Uncharacterised protein [Mycobacteroides abscessus subsp. abscessus]|nr:Uncharacterised protein [Mycobacteroides abscessus subsp. abscessus]